MNAAPANASVAPERPEPPPAQTEDLAQILLKSGKIQPRDLQRALAAQSEIGGQLEDVLVQLGLVSETDVVLGIAQELGLAFVPYEAFPAVMPEIQGLSPEYFREHNALPLNLEDGTLTVVVSRPRDAFLPKALHLATGLPIKMCVGLESDIRKALIAPGATEPGASDEPQDGGDFVEHLRDLASEAPVIRLVNQIIGRVVDLRASDIHLEPFDDGLHARYRVDGVIATHEVIAERLSAAVCSRVKLMAHLDIAERRLPQDGRIKTRVKGRELDLRVSTVPTVHGESLVMRVLDRSSVQLSMAQMGFLPDVLEGFNQLLSRPHGIVLVTGPTGSGKTTTLYAALAKQDADAQKIITVEEPVEYQLNGVNQIQVNAPIGLSFARALRSILRQDPDIIMIGEMRDGETAQIAVQAALTGHLVLSTLHTNTATGAVVRLQDIGVERYLITSSVNGVLSQRLLRTLCPHCKQAQVPSETVRQSSGLHRYLPPEQALYTAKGCPQCRHTGYQGRTGIHELLILDDALRRKILDGVDASELHQHAVRAGMLSLYEDGLRKVASGVTSLEELLRVTEDQGDA
jgi:general secretion pathway protein E